MLGQILTLLVAVLILVPLAEAGPPLFLLLPPLLAGLGWAAVRAGGKVGDRAPATAEDAWRPTVLRAGLGVALLVGAGWAMGVAGAVLAMACGGLLLALAACRTLPLAQLGLLLAVPPALAFALVRPQGGGGAGLAAWWCAGLPGLLLLWERRQVLALLPAGLLGLILALCGALAGSGLAAAELLPGLRPGGGLLAVGQGLIVAGGVLPLLLGADRRWRRLALAGVAVAALPPLVAAASGPWPDGAPAWLGSLAQAGLLAGGAGLFGMLCTVRQPERLVEAVLRVLVLGLAASTALLAAGRPWAGLAAALAPLIWALALGLVLGLAAMVAGRGRQEGEPREPARGRSSASLVWSRLTSWGRRLGHGGEDGAARWFHLQGLVPAAILASALPGLAQLGPRWRWAPLLVLAAVPAPVLMRLGLAPWLLAQAGLGLALGLLLGLPPSGLLALSALALLVCGPWAAWPRLGAGWAYPALLLLVTVLAPLLTGAAVPRPELVLLVGISVLMGNLLLPGLARVPVLAVTLVVLLSLLLDWIPACDPYATVQLAEMGGVGELLPLAIRLPFIALPLLALWVVHDRVERGLHRPGWALTCRLLVPGGAALPLWIAVPELVTPWTGLAAWLLLTQALPLVAAELRDSLRSSVARLFSDGLAISLALLLLILGKALAAMAAHGGGTLPAGVLGGLLVPAVRDLVALTVTVGVLLAGRGLLHYRMQVAAVLTQTASYARVRGSALFARLRRPVPAAPVAAQGASAAPRRKGFRGRRKSIPAG